MPTKVKLSEMVTTYNEEISAAERQITALTVLTDDLTEQKQAIENIVLSALTSASDIYLNNQVTNFQTSGGYPFATKITSGGYGTSNLTEWKIYSGNTPPFPSGAVILKSDSPSASQAQKDRQDDFEEAYGHINDDIDVGTGTYGILAKRSNLNTGKSVLTKNKNKLETVVEIYERYT